MIPSVYPLNALKPPISALFLTVYTVLPDTHIIDPIRIKVIGMCSP